MRMTLPSICISWISTFSDTVLRAETSLSAVVPLLVMVMKPPPVRAVGAVARVHGVVISSEPSL